MYDENDYVGRKGAINTFCGRLFMDGWLDDADRQGSRTLMAGSAGPVAQVRRGRHRAALHAPIHGLEIEIVGRAVTPSGATRERIGLTVQL